MVVRYKITPEGYKSFYGGWIEGMSEDNHVYYYNTITGESAWQLPDELGGVAEENSQQLADWNSVEHLHEPTHHFLDSYAATDAAAAANAVEGGVEGGEGGGEEAFSGYQDGYQYNYETGEWELRDQSQQQIEDAFYGEEGIHYYCVL